MFIFGIIAAGLAVLLSVAGFVIITFGLWRSFARDAFNRAIYLGLALISTAAIIFALSGPIFIGGLVVDFARNQDDTTTTSAPLYEEPAPVAEESPSVSEEDETIEGDDDLESTNSLGFVDPTALTEESAAMTNGNYFPECIESENAGDFFYDVSGLDGVTSAYLVPISPDEVYVVSDTNQGPAILYVNSDDYALAGANDVATDYLYLAAPEDLGFDPIDTSSEAYIAAEGCVS